jgi:hypothetical protein
MHRHRLWVMVTLLNAVLAFSIQAIAPPEPTLSDRSRYEYAGAHPFAPVCPPSLYCFRVAVPAVLELVPLDPELRWRVYRWAAITAAGTIVALTSASLAGGGGAAVVATILTQGSYGFAFTAYDPYSADPAVFAGIALLAWCWGRDRWRLALAIGVAGIFVKETLALMSVATALAALLGPRRPQWTAWVAQGTIVVALLLLYRWVMPQYWGWGPVDFANLVQNDLAGGGWLTLWLEGNPPATRAFVVFVTFGFAWVFAALGFRSATPDWRNLAIGSLLPFLALNYVQNPERALGNLFFVVIPLAALTLSRVPMRLAIAAALLSSVISARAGSSSNWLPATKYMLLPAALSAVAVVWFYARRRDSLAGKPM